ncbi:MAG: TetR/AcrR family transcriptional regulator [Planctomycetota bacterium]
MTSNTKDLLIEAAIEVLASEPSASLSEIAEAAGVKRMTLHRLIGTRDELLKEIAIRSLHEMDAACNEATQGAKTAIAALRACVEALVPLGDRCHFLWSLTEIWEEPSVAKETARQDQELSDLIDVAKAEGSIAADIPNAWIVASIEALVFAAFQTSRSGSIDAKDAGKLATRTLFAGIEARPNRKARAKK